MFPGPLYLKMLFRFHVFIQDLWAHRNQGLWELNYYMELYLQQQIFSLLSKEYLNRIQNILTTWSSPLSQSSQETAIRPSVFWHTVRTAFHIPLIHRCIWSWVSDHLGIVILPLAFLRILDIEMMKIYSVQLPLFAIWNPPFTLKQIKELVARTVNPPPINQEISRKMRLQKRPPDLRPYRLL